MGNDENPGLLYYTYKYLQEIQLNINLSIKKNNSFAFIIDNCFPFLID